MAWRRGRFRGDRVFVQVDEAGRPAETDGRVTIRYRRSAGAKSYEAGAARVTVDPDAQPEDLPAPDEASTAPSRAVPPSGFGKAGTRSAEQTVAAAAHARRHLADLPPATVVVFTDGACRGNPGPAGSGAVVLPPGGPRIEASLALGHATNNVAELSAVGLALDLLDEAKIDPETPVVIYTDSNYTNGVLALGWKAKANPELIAHLRARLRARPGARLAWVAGHVGLEGNERADSLANDGVAGRTTTTRL